MRRRVEPELLDELPPEDSRAQRSRRDLQRLNRLLGHARILEAAVERALGHPPCRLIELGAGDGTVLLEVARHRRAEWQEVEVVLVDRWRVVDPETLGEFRRLGWQVETVAADVRTWLERAPLADAVLVNLLLHHFSESELRELLGQAAEVAHVFVACEPRRNLVSRLGARLVGILGCGPVTRCDARRSVAAGFRGQELSVLWPKRGWELVERRVGLFTHLFVARRRK